MANQRPPLHIYLKNRKERGLSNNQIIQELIEHGWNKENAQKAVLDYSNQEFRNKQKKGLPMDAGVLVAFILLIFVIGAGIYYAASAVKEFRDTQANKQANINATINKQEGYEKNYNKNIYQNTNIVNANLTNTSKAFNANIYLNTNTVSNTNTTSNTNSAAMKTETKTSSTDHVRGSDNASVTLIEYSDFQCPFCARVQSTYDKILEEYPDQVKLIYRHFPLSFHQNAKKAAEAAECAGDQNKFWEMHDTLFANQNNLDVDSLKDFAKELNLNTSTFNGCLDSGQYEQRIQSDLAEGTKDGVSGTPATFVNGELISGAQPYDVFKTAIDQALAEE